MNKKIQKATIPTLFLSYIGLFKRNTVSGDSMNPLLHDGDIVFSKKTTTFNVGDIVIAKHPFQNKEIIKQIASIDGDRYELRGLNNNGSEDSRTFGMVYRKSILRVVVGKK